MSSSLLFSSLTVKLLLYILFYALTHLALPGAAIMTAFRNLFRIFSKKLSDDTIETEASCIASAFNLDEDEKRLTALLLAGINNNNIAFENKQTLSTVKHRIYQLYRKCGINSRRELLALCRTLEKSK